MNQSGRFQSLPLPSSVPAAVPSWRPAVLLVHSDVTLSTTCALAASMLSSVPGCGSSSLVVVTCDADSVSATSSAVFNGSFTGSGGCLALVDDPGSQVVETSGFSSAGFSVGASRSADEDEDG